MTTCNHFQKTVYSARDYLLCQLMFATGTRPGALNNVLPSDYETSRVSEGHQIILVPKHKRTEDGPTNAEGDGTYMSKIWPAFANHDEEKLFVKDDTAGFPAQLPNMLWPSSSEVV